MYCKHCGKQIDEDSKYCQYCGERVAALVKEEQLEANSSNQEFNLSTKEDSSSQVEISTKKANKRSIIANEIVSNLKMISFAVISWIIFMIGFIVYHQKDIKQFPDSYYGESCYDEPPTLNDGSFDWKEILSEYKVYRELERNDKPFKRRSSIPIFNLPDEALERKAKEKAEENKASFNENLNVRRKYSYEADKKQKAKYSAIILLAFFIVGRYSIKLAKWVNNNKTK